MVCHKKQEIVAFPIRKGTTESLAINLERRPDLLKSGNAAKITGYSDTAVVTWCNFGELHGFLIRRTYLVSKKLFNRFYVVKLVQWQ